MEEVGGDGYLFSLPNVSRRTLAEIEDGLVPALENRGLVRKAYALTAAVDDRMARLGAPAPIHGTEEEVTGEQMIAGLKQMAVRAHSRGIRIISATLIPFGNETLHGQRVEPDAREAPGRG